MNEIANHSSPPKWPLKLLRHFIKEEYLEEIEGDMEEKYWDNLEHYSPKKAKRLYEWDSLKLLRPALMKRVSGDYQLNNYGMFKNYFITSMRSLMKNKGFSAINIVGLAIGFTTFALISFYVYNELSFDKYHKNADRIFRITENLRTENEILFQSTSSPPMGPRFLKDFPEVENYVRFQRWRLLGQRNGLSSYEPDSYIADSTVFDIFSFNLLQGDKKTALRDPFSIVLTKSMAIKYFGDEDPLGQSLKMDYDNYKVTGVMEDVPENSHFRFSNLISFSTWSRNNKNAEDDAWFWNGFHTYLLLRDASDGEKVREKMSDFITRNIEKGGMYYEDLPLQSLGSIYMAPPRSWENGTRGSMSNVYILSTIALFVLITACFNYINLATARASRRLKEVGLRKSLGALRRMLVTQFLGESLVVTFISALLAVVMIWFALPPFRTLIESPLSLSILPNPWVIAGTALALTLIVGVLAGAYPAFIVSGFRPVNIFRPSTKGMFGHHSIRKTLVGMQFVISITLVAGTMLVYDQLNVVRSQDLGFDKEGILVVPTNGDTAIVN